MSTWIQTYTGKKFDLLRPRPEMVCLEDIAHSLSRLCRFTGHTKDFYSVAEHSVHVSNSVISKYARSALMHDAHEAYIGDLTSPLKRAMREGPLDNPFEEIERVVWKAVSKRFDLTDSYGELMAIRNADLAVLAAERDCFFPKQTEDWGVNVEPAKVAIQAFSPANAWYHFMNQAKLLGVE